MATPPPLAAFLDGWARQQELLLESIRPLTDEQMQLRPAPGEWAIWQLCGNMAGGRLYWFCHMLGEDDRGLSGMFRVDHATVPGISLEWAGWEDNTDRPRTAAEVEAAFVKTWTLVQGYVDGWSVDDLGAEVEAVDAWGERRVITRGQVLWRVMSHEVHHGAEVSLILRVHGLPTALNR